MDLEILHDFPHRTLPRPTAKSCRIISRQRCLDRSFDGSCNMIGFITALVEAWSKQPQGGVEKELTRGDPEGFHRGTEKAWYGGVHKLCQPKIDANHAGRRSERQPPVGNDAGYLHDPTRLHHPRNVCPVCSSAMNAAKLSYLHA
jgi:hypothetical protein